MIHVPHGSKGPGEYESESEYESDDDSECDNLPPGTMLHVFTPNDKTQVQYDTNIVFGYVEGGYPSLFVDDEDTGNSLFISSTPFECGNLNIKVVSSSGGAALKKGWHDYKIVDGPIIVSWRVYQCTDGPEYDPCDKPCPPFFPCPPPPCHPCPPPPCHPCPPPPCHPCPPPPWCPPMTPMPHPGMGWMPPPPDFYDSEDETPEPSPIPGTDALVSALEGIKAELAGKEKEKIEKTQLALPDKEKLEKASTTAENANLVQAQSHLVTLSNNVKLSAPVTPHPGPVVPVSVRPQAQSASVPVSHGKSDDKSNNKSSGKSSDKSSGKSSRTWQDNHSSRFDESEGEHDQDHKPWKWVDNSQSPVHSDRHKHDYCDNGYEQRPVSCDRSEGYDNDSCYDEYPPYESYDDSDCSPYHSPKHSRECSPYQSPKHSDRECSPYHSPKHSRECSPYQSPKHSDRECSPYQSPKHSDRECSPYHSPKHSDRGYESEGREYSPCDRSPRSGRGYSSDDNDGYYNNRSGSFMHQGRKYDRDDQQRPNESYEEYCRRFYLKQNQY
jgi:hypothetical protein